MADGSAPILLTDVEPYCDDAIVVLFAGGGGSDIAIEGALGRGACAALNHWHVALGVHEINYPETAHYLADVMETDCRSVLPGRKIGLPSQRAMIFSRLRMVWPPWSATASTRYSST